MRKLLLSLVSVVALFGGLYLSARYFAEPQMPPDGSLVGSQRPDFRLAGKDGDFMTAADFAGKTMLLNFWATWCAPCRREMPMLMDLQRELGPRGLQVVGIALDEVQDVRDFVQQYDISYPILVGDFDAMEASDAYGNVGGVLPFSVLVDRQGVIRWQYAGEIRREQVVGLLSELL